MNHQDAKPLDFSGIASTLQVIFHDDPHKLKEALDLAVEEVVKAAQQNNKPSSLVVEIKVKPGRNRSVSMAANLAVKIPKPEIISVPLFTDIRGRVYSEDPKQPKLDFDGETPENVVPITGSKKE